MPRPPDPSLVPPLVLSIGDVVYYARQAGFRGTALVDMVAIVGAETGGTWDAHAIGDRNLTETGEMSVGLTQINYRPSRDVGDAVRDPTANLDPATNLRHGYSISGGGRSFRPWSTYKSGAYRRFLVAAQAAVSHGGGSGIVGTGAAPTDVEDAIPIMPGTPIPVTLGRNTPGDLGASLVGGSVDFTTSQVSEITFEIEDPGLHLFRNLDISVGRRIDYGPLHLVVVEPSTTQGPANPHLVLRCHPIGAVRMRQTSPAAARQVSPTDYMTAVAREAGLHFVGEASGKRSGDIGPKKIKDTSGTLPITRLETGWEVGQRLADELGFYAFESGGVYHFGTSLYLQKHGRTVQVSWEGLRYPGPYSLTVEALTVPLCRASRRTYHAASTVNGAHRDAVDILEDTTVTATVERTPGTQIRPGMNLILAGVGSFDGPGKIVTRVSWSLTDRTAPVQVEASLLDQLPASNRTADDNSSSDVFDSPSTGGDRISQTSRIAAFGQPGDTVRYRTFETPWGLHVLVHQRILSSFASACADAHKNASWRPRRIDSYNKRLIRGGSEWSLHAFALAWDFFSTPAGVDPPGGVWGPESAPDAQFRAIFKSHGFYLGADFRNRKDYPHIEWASMP